MRFPRITQRLIDTACILFLTCSMVSLFGQDLQSIESKRWEIIKEIELLSSQLSETHSEKSKTSDLVQSLGNAMKREGEKIEEIKTTIEVATVNIGSLQDSIQDIENSIAHVLNPYKESLRKSYRKKLVHPQWISFFHVKTWNALLMNRIFIKQYDKSLKNNAEKIVQEAKRLHSAITAHEKEKNNQAQILQNAEDELESMQLQYEQADSTLQSLVLQESRLTSALTEFRKTREILNKAVEELKTKNPDNE